MKKFLRVVKGILTENILFKLGSLVFAFLVWLAVVNVNDPEITKTINAIPIEVTDPEALTRQNLEYNLIGENVAQITITGKRSKVSNLSSSDFIAKAPLSQMSKVYSVPVYVEFKNAAYQNYVIINQKTKTIQVSVESVVTKEFDVTINTEGQPFTGYEIGQEIIGRDKIDITGRASVLNLINKVCVDVDVSDATRDIVGKYDIKLYQADGEEIDPSKVSMSSQRTKVKIEILMTKSILINYNIEGEPDKDCTVTDVENSATELKVIGKPDDVSKCENITLPKGTFDISGKIRTTTITVDLEKYLPDGVKIYDSENRKFQVVITIEKMVTKMYELNKENVKWTNVPEGYQAALLSSKIIINVKALPDNHNMFDVNRINFYVDLSGSTKEIDEYQVSFSLPDGYEVINDVKAKVKILKKETNEETQRASEIESSSEATER
ncbi:MULTISPECIES: YbbR-like domain-containing protein [Eubacterium]|uniref:YbbR domain-containing protein n=1 Tax=Eubacterium uniforme TaxID=39495 RepID=A0A1T4W0K9_9FIRM|nr:MULTISPECIES: CdaR family protein [Eubacterium]MCR5629830.1 hypothetical protein [Eubacterium sp.]SKA70679.1 YbbR domain-containing protein [Eubacterium uniforme]HAH18571.1 hypothetical protein [Eubacterium sp.]HAV90568.1 hypothetical protein [Eubacterium sp.]